LYKWYRAGKGTELALKQHVRASFNGNPFSNEVSYLVKEYADRERLAKLGYTSNLNDEDDFILQAFLVIDRQIDTLQKEKTKKGRK